MVVTGSLLSDVNGAIAGTINGDISINGKLIIKKEAVINGDIVASHIIASGKIMGDIICSGRLVLKNNAYIKGSIQTLEIQIEKDAFVDGIITKTSDLIIEDTTIETETGGTIMESSIIKKAKAKAQAPPETWF